MNVLAKFYPTIQKRVLCELVKIMDNTKKGYVQILDVVEFIFNNSRHQKVSLVI